MIMKYINKLIGYRYWYTVKMIYKDKKTMIPIFSLQYQIGVLNRKEILDSKKRKESLPPLHKYNISPNNLLCNGIIHTEISCYIGWFKK